MKFNRRSIEILDIIACLVTPIIMYFEVCVDQNHPLLIVLYFSIASYGLAKSIEMFKNRDFLPLNDIVFL